jgi:glutamine amidotransferase-like uncharacterized protein
MFTKKPRKELKIACLSYQGISQGGIEPALQYMFPNSQVYSIFPQHIRRHDLKSYDILILPGINDEDSPYPTLLPPTKMEAIQETMEQDGLILWTFCASSYYMFEEISYQKRNGEIKKRHGAGFIKGTARHGFNHITRKVLNSSPWQDYILAGIHVDGHRDLLRALNINGPSMLPAPSEASLVHQFMKYKDIDGAAGITKKIGKGLLIALGVHPELSPDHPKLPDYFADFEKDRLDILWTIRQKILGHWSHTNGLDGVHEASSGLMMVAIDNV